MGGVFLKMSAPELIPRITQAASKSFYIHFNEHRWEKLPKEKELLELADLHAIIAQYNLFFNIPLVLVAVD